MPIERLDEMSARFISIYWEEEDLEDYVRNKFCETQIVPPTHEKVPRLKTKHTTGIKKQDNQMKCTVCASDCLNLVKYKTELKYHHQICEACSRAQAHTNSTKCINCSINLPRQFNTYCYRCLQQAKLDYDILQEKYYVPILSPKVFNAWCDKIEGVYDSPITIVPFIKTKIAQRLLPIETIKQLVEALGLSECNIAQLNSPHTITHPGPSFKFKQLLVRNGGRLPSQHEFIVILLCLKVSQIKLIEMLACDE